MIEQVKTKFPRSVGKIFNETSELFHSLPWEDRDFYAQWIAQTYYMVSHTPRFICLAAARFGVEKDHWHRSLVEHFNDEDGHEYMLLENLKSLGFEIDSFPELPETSIIVQQLYYAIDRWDPVSIFGRIFFLEAMVAQFSEDLKNKFKSLYSEKESSFIRVHFEEDMHHVEKAFSNISKLDETGQKIVGDNFYLTGLLYKNFLKAIASESGALTKIPEAVA